MRAPGERVRACWGRAPSGRSGKGTPGRARGRAPIARTLGPASCRGKCGLTEAQLKEDQGLVLIVLCKVFEKIFFYI